MGKYIYEGLQTSLEGVPQTQTFLTGKNLPGPLKKPLATKPSQDPPTNGEEEVKP